jgi:protein-L-isoaspartate(D-aspartate) O-methyltransferase
LQECDRSAERVGTTPTTNSFAAAPKIPTLCQRSDSCRAACRVYGWGAVLRTFCKLNGTYMLGSGTYGTRKQPTGNEAILEEILVSDTGELDLERRRQAMVMIIAVHANLCANEIGKDELSDRIMQAMASVPRHRFVPVELQGWAYEDLPLPVGHGKTISQPFIVALMTDLLAVEEHDKVLEIGTGFGYQAAVLAELAKSVFSVEIIAELAREGERRLRGAGYDKVQLRIGDGSRGWPEHAPFDKIMITAAPEFVPERLLEQLKPGGRMVLPVGVEEEQKLVVVEKGNHNVRTRELIAVRFSPLITSH